MNDSASTKDRWNAKLYDERHSYVSNYGDALLDILTREQQVSGAKTLCDLGCGTGDLSYKISTLGMEVVGIDHSANMIAEAKEKYPQINFQVQDVLKIQFAEPIVFDMVFSNAVFHWVQQVEELIKSIAVILKPKGVLVCEFGGEANIKKIVTAINAALDYFNLSELKNNNPWNFVSPAEFGMKLEKNGFEIKSLQYYDRFTKLDQGEIGMRNWIEMFATGFFNDVDEPTYKEMLAFIENQLRPDLYKNGDWYADYKRLQVVACKKGNYINALLVENNS